MKSTNNKIQRNYKEKTYKDISLWTLLISNFIVIYLAINENWNLMTILWIYWFQSIIIGFFNFLKILMFKNSLDNNSFNKKIGFFKTSDKKIKIYAGTLFVFFYTLFHFIYFLFLVNGFFFVSHLNKGIIPSPEIKSVLQMSLLFFINHLFSFLYNLKEPLENKSLWNIITQPFSRIIPMHFIIIFSGFFIFTSNSQTILLFFLLLKTLLDISGHLVKHNRKNSDQLRKFNKH